MSLKLTVSLVSLSLFPLAKLSLELQLAGEEHLSPAYVLGQGAHVRRDGVTGRLHYLLPQFVRRAQLWAGRARGESCQTRGKDKSFTHSHSHCPIPVACETLEETGRRHEDAPDMVPTSFLSSWRKGRCMNA